MIVTARAARWLQSLPDADAAALLDAVVDVAAAPLDSGPRCKKLAPGLYEARLTLHHHRAYRCMFGFRAGVPVLLSACLKKSHADHQCEINHARAALSSDDIPQGEPLMAKNAPPLFSSTAGWIYSGTRQYRIVHHTRRKIVVQTDTGPVELNRARLERDGQDVVNGIAYRTTKYVLPSEAMENIA